MVLATVATVIASQALISGAFSLTMQAVQFGYLPRVRIIHTSAEERGQIYVPVVNWALMIACVGLVLGFRSSSGLAAAYGVAVTMTMVITTVLFYVVARRHFGWSRAGVPACCAAPSWSSTWRSSPPTSPRSPRAAGSRSSSGAWSSSR